jgi:predicted DNA-binding protein (UPF0251 family)
VGGRSRQAIRWDADGRNKTQSPAQDVMAEYGLHLVRKCVSMALNGDPRAMRMCMDRVSPAPQDACIRMSLPPITTAQDVDRAAEKVTQAIQRGKITPAEGGKMMNILESRSRIIEKVHLEPRVEKLEEMANANLPRAA